MARDTTGARRSAGLPLSVGAASLPVRVLIAFVFLVVALVCGAGGLFVATRGPLAASIVAVIFLLPFAFIALIAAAFVIAPWSRFGRWLDAFLPTLAGVRALVVAIVFWVVAAILVFVMFHVPHANL